MSLLLLQAAAPEHRTTLESLQESLGSLSFWFKVFVLVVLAPAWYPIVKAIYGEINAALRSEGGIWAREYTPVEISRFSQEDGLLERPLTSIPRGPRSLRSKEIPSQAPSKAAASAQRGPLRANRSRRRSF